MAGILSGLGKGIIGAGAAIGQGIAGLKTPAEKEAERLKNEALSISGELGKLNLSGVKAKRARDAQLATQTAQTAGQARDFISGFQNKLADAREGEGFEAFNDEEEIKRLALKDRLGSGGLVSQIFKENLTQLPSGIAQNKQVQDFQTTLTNAEAPIISEAEKLKNKQFELSKGIQNTETALKEKKFDLELQKFNQNKVNTDLDRKKAVENNFITEDNREIYKTLDTKYTKATAEHAQALDNLSRLEALLKGDNISGTDQIAAIFTFMKGLDPRSVVRESEFRLPESASGVWDRGMNLFNKYKEGEFLPPEVIEQMKETARKLKGYYGEAMGKANERYTFLANEAQLKPAWIIGRNNDGSFVINNVQVQSFDTVEDAEASGVKGEVLIGGRKAFID